MFCFDDCCKSIWITLWTQRYFWLSFLSAREFNNSWRNNRKVFIVTVCSNNVVIFLSTVVSVQLLDLPYLDLMTINFALNCLTFYYLVVSMAIEHVDDSSHIVYPLQCYSVSACKAEIWTVSSMGINGTLHPRKMVQIH